MWTVCTLMEAQRWALMMMSVSKCAARPGRGSGEFPTLSLSLAAEKEKGDNAPKGAALGRVGSGQGTGQDRTGDGTRAVAALASGETKAGLAISSNGCRIAFGNMLMKLTSPLVGGTKSAGTRFLYGEKRLRSELSWTDRWWQNLQTMESMAPPWPGRGQNQTVAQRQQHPDIAASEQ
ncbi:hypothetical protein AXG93_3228s1240 [Marchantia polymorpha subsp. ruderalis]|uniref:Uncharacterized protein n=1 Tax=Marchantia polymorpha subsp. ruderalis TaxID=1480154 RepID=A0A176WHK5_MARPO|nr:hypothetical protein AXG93_3228s1240 [Marchantia polymorpha subsp. ruderalis]